MVKAPRIIKNAQPHIFINGQRITQSDMQIPTDRSWRQFLAALDSTMNRIKEGKDYSVLSCLSYYYKTGVKGCYEKYSVENLLKK